MNREESIALYEQGKDAWNKWAQGMLAEKKRMEKTGEWFEEGYSINSSIEKTANWLKAAQADLANYTFDQEVDFSGFIFPCDAIFTKTLFKKSAKFISTTFYKDVRFSMVVFKRDVEFTNACFHEISWFIGTRFEKMAIFTFAKFHISTEFIEAYFGENTEFGGVVFRGETTFESTYFNGSTGFHKSIFVGETDFKAITTNSIFSLQQANFHQLPDFRQAHFREAPDLDNITIHTPASIDPDIAAQYRALKKLAIQGHDHEQELNFFAGELEAKGSFIGKLYRWFSDYGRSLSSPFLGWIVTMLYATMGYHSLSLSNEGSSNKIFQLETCSKTLDAFELALRKGLLALGWEKSSRLDQIYSCLYGKAEPAVSFAVSMGGLVQTVLSAVFIFLFLLALRNRFRIK